MIGKKFKFVSLKKALELYKTYDFWCKNEDNFADDYNEWGYSNKIYKIISEPYHPPHCNKDFLYVDIINIKNNKKETIWVKFINHFSTNVGITLPKELFKMEL